jgi:bacterial/archaeal transporter family-2 protein
MKLLAIIGGMLIAIMVTLNGELSRSYPPFVTILIFNLVGLLVIFVLVLIKKSDLRSFKKKIPLYYFLPGLFSVVLTLFNNICIVNIGVSVTLALAIVGQAVFSTVIDSFGLMAVNKTPFDKRKILGFVIIGAGIFCIVYL